MSNNMNTPPTIRWQLLSTVSAVALLASAYTASEAQVAGNDADHPLIWIELGSQMERISGQGAIFDPAFIAANPTSPVLGAVTPLQAQRPPKFSFGEEGKISFLPEGSDWIFSAAIRYGRSGNARHVQHQTMGVHYKYYHNGVPTGGTRTIEKFADTHAGRSESHSILDFTTGKDVGLGLLGSAGSSTLNFGVRFAQFTSKASFDIRARPDLQFKYATFPSFGVTFKFSGWRNYHASGYASREFHGVGPTLSWTGTAPFVGNRQDGELSFDWGVNGAILFGKQKAHVQHHESEQSKPPLMGYTTIYDPPVYNRDVSRSVTIPNVGASVGLSWRVQDFKVSLGYRTDMFFGAMDTGIDAVKKSNATFNGPYASISVGLGD